MPHLAVFGAGTINDLIVPIMAQSPQATFSSFPPLYQKRNSCAMKYKSGLLYCTTVLGVCLYHKLGSSGWTQPPEMQPELPLVQAGCAIFNGMLWITGGALSGNENPNKSKLLGGTVKL